jgi:hypothetical protein
MPKPRLKAVPRRVLTVLQSEPGEGWVERDWLIEHADIRLPDQDLDTRIGAVWDAINALTDAGYKIENYRDVAGDWFRLAPKNTEQSET